MDALQIWMGTKITELPFVCTQNMTRVRRLFSATEVKFSAENFVDNQQNKKDR